MTAVDFAIKAGDALPILSTSLTDAMGNPIDLTNATGIQFLMAAEGAQDLAVNAAAAITSPASGGNVQYAWEAGDTDIPGSYLASFQVTFPAGTQSFPSDGFIAIDVEPSLTSGAPETALIEGICTPAQVQQVTGQTVDVATVQLAWACIENVTGRPLSELLLSLDNTKTVLTDRDRYWLMNATAWQAVWLDQNPDMLTALDVTNANQSGQSGTFNVDGLVLAPMARRSLRWVSWNKTRSVKIQRPLPYNRLMNPTVTDDMGSPWGRMS